MPELPEVETTRRGIEPYLVGQKVVAIDVRQPQLRLRVPDQIQQDLPGQVINSITRRSKYLLLHFDRGTLIIHLGMSGRLSILNELSLPKKHDHIDILFTNKKYLRFTDPRRFGIFLWTNDDPLKHPLLTHIGKEPFDPSFSGQDLFERARGKKISVKAFIMDSKTLAGVGNIYATEALFAACIRPQMEAGKVTLLQYEKLAKAIKIVLKKALDKGGTTLKDFAQSDGSPGYFSIQLKAYGREGKACLRCRTPLKNLKLGQRSTVYCETCQK